MNKKLIIVGLSFLLLIPFRLPIGVLFINIVSIIAEVGSNGMISNGILSANVTVTKIIYNLILSSMFVYNIEMLSRSILKRNPRIGSIDEFAYYWTIILASLLLCYIIFDSINTYDLYYQLKGITN